MSSQAMHEAAVAIASICFVKVDSEEIAQFYLSLSAEGRRERFCAAMSDDAIVRYCNGLYSSRAFIVASRTRGQIDGVLEVHALQDDWRHAEVAICCRSRTERRCVLANLLQVAAWEAGRRCCERLLTTASGDATFNHLFSALGARHYADDTSSVDIPTYVPSIANLGPPL